MQCLTSRKSQGSICLAISTQNMQIPNNKVYKNLVWSESTNRAYKLFTTRSIKICFDVNVHDAQVLSFCSTLLEQSRKHPAWTASRSSFPGSNVEPTVKCTGASLNAAHHQTNVTFRASLNSTHHQTNVTFRASLNATHHQTSIISEPHWIPHTIRRT